jgi:hypothetical protein
VRIRLFTRIHNNWKVCVNKTFFYNDTLNAESYISDLLFPAHKTLHFFDILYLFKKKRKYWQLKEEALDRTLWRTRFGRGYGPVVIQTTK